MAATAERSTPEPAPGLVQYRRGDELSPSRPAGRVELSVRADGTLRLDHRVAGRTRTWTATADPALWPHLTTLAHHASPLPDPGPDTAAPHVTTTELPPPTSAAALDARAALARLHATLEDLTNQIGGPTVAATANLLPRLVHGIVRQGPADPPPPPGEGAALPALSASWAAATFTGGGPITLHEPATTGSGTGSETGSGTGSDAGAGTGAGGAGRSGPAVLGGGPADGSLRAVALGGRAGGPGLLAAAGDDRTVAVWELDDPGEARYVLAGVPGPVLAVAGVPGGGVVLAGGADGAVRVWRDGTAEPLGTLPHHPGHDGAVTALLAVSLPDSDAAHAGSTAHSRSTAHAAHAEDDGDDRDGGDGRNGEDLGDVGEPAGRTVVVSAGEDGVVLVVDPDDGGFQHRLAGHRGWVNVLAAATVAGRRVLASGGVDRTIRIWDLDTGEALGSLTGHEGSVTGLVFAGAELVSCALDGSVRCWNPVRGTTTRGWPAGSDWPAGLVIASVDGRPVIVAAGSDGAVHAWRSDGSPAWPSTPADDPANGPAGDPDEGSADHPAERPAGAPADGPAGPGGAGDTPRSEAGAAVGIAVLGEGDAAVLATGHRDGTVRVWELGGGRLVHAAPAVDAGAVVAGAVAAVAGNGTGGAATALLYGTDAGAVVVHGVMGGGATVRGADGGVGPGTAGGGVAMGEPVVVSAPAERVLALAFAGEGGELLVTGGGDGGVRVWDGVSGLPVRWLGGHPGGVTALAAGTVEGRAAVASAGYDGVVRVWEAGGGYPLAVVDAGPYPAYQLAFGVVGGADVVAAGGYDGAVRVWDAATGKPVATVGGNPGLVRALALGSFDGTAVLAVGCDDGAVRLWHLPTGVALGGTELPWSPLAARFASATGLVVAGPDGLVTLDWRSLGRGASG